MIGATVDTNIYISAFTSAGPSSRLLVMGVDGLIRIDVSDAIISEVLRVLRTKFEWDAYSLNDVSQRIRKFAHHVAPTQTIEVVKEDPDDNRILECAVAAASDFIVSADKDLLRLKRYEGIEVVNATAFLQRVTRR